MYLTIEHPVYLWYLFSIPLLIITHFLSLRSARKKAMRFANFVTIKRIAGKRFVTKNTPILILRVLTLSMLIMAASGMQLWYKAELDNNNYVLAIDSSSSMVAKDIQPTRIDAAKQYALEFAKDARPNTKIGVISFSGITMIHQFMTEDKDIIKASIGEITINKAGGTDIPGAIITGTNLLLATPKEGRAVILFTDGSSTLGKFMDQSTQMAINYAKDNNVIVHAIGIGSESSPIGFLPEYYNISANYDEDFLFKITNSTGGTLLEAKNVAELRDSITKLEDLSDEGYATLKLYVLFLIGGILLLFVEWGLLNARYRRLT